MNSYHSTLGETPQEAWNKTHLIPKENSEIEIKRTNVAIAGHIYLLTERAKKCGERNEKRKNKRKNVKKIEEGDIVWVKDERKDKRVKESYLKLRPLYPWKAEVIQNMRNGTYKVKFLEGPKPYPEEGKCYRVKLYKKKQCLELVNDSENEENVNKEEIVESYANENEEKEVEQVVVEDVDLANKYDLKIGSTPIRKRERSRRKRKRSCVDN